MNYALAKELKEAGFSHPQGWLTWQEELVDDPNFFPDLEELIEACGCVQPKKSPFLQLRSARAGWCAALHGDDDVNIEMALNEPTPTEAVARLWLALNKKL